jgi:hypothetical protein
LQKVNPVIDWKNASWTYSIDSQGIELIRSKKELKKVVRKAKMALILTESSATQPTFNNEINDISKQNAFPPEYENYANVFSTKQAGLLLSHYNLEHRIKLENGKMPPFGPIYAFAKKEQQKLCKYLEINLQRGLIRYSRSPAGAPILFVPKKNGKLRLCVNYRKLNQITKKNRNTLPFISEILDKLGSAKIFIKFDLKNIYHRLRIKKNNEWKTVFRTKYGYFEYLVMPFGFINAPATF